MNATAKNGDIWTGEMDGSYWIYTDSNGKLYESKEVPHYRIIMDGATQIRAFGGKPIIIPKSAIYGNS